MKHIGHRARILKQRKKAPFRFLRPFAGRLLVAGHILILLSLCHFAALLSGEGQSEALLYMESYMGSVSASFTVLWAASLGMDWLDRTHKGRE